MKTGIQNIQVIGNELAIIWKDGRESYFPLESLRKHCPCAGCGGEPDVMGNIVKPHVSYNEKSFTIRGINQVGGYAIQIEWEDGHNTGLYTHPYLQKWEPAIRSGQG
ncbi:MAG: DUF971 domain-containing protein [Verrucomicrobiota bacterium]